MIIGDKVADKVGDKMKKKFKISTIIPVYNVENYLEETIKSVLDQTIGLDNIQIILVNDGSTDQSEKICLKYADLYPHNIMYMKQKNSGVSVARNKGFMCATGEYINFLDSDDLWDRNAYAKGIKLLDKNKEICAAIYPIKFFDGSNMDHPLNIMFKKTRVIDIRNDYEFIKLSSCSMLFRRDILTGYKYNTRLKISEDVRLINEMFLDNPIVGVVSNSYYRYRKRINQSSTIQTQTSKKTWYIDTPKLCYNYLINLSVQKYGKIIDYIKYLLMYDLHWRMDVEINDCLNDKEKKEYLKTMHSLVSTIDDDFIIESPFMNVYQKLYMLSFKYNSNKIFSIKNDVLYLNEKEIQNIGMLSLIVDNIVIENDVLNIYGRYNRIKNLIDEVLVKIDDKYVSVRNYELDKSHCNIHIDNNISFPVRGFHINLNIANTKNFEFYVETSNCLYKPEVIFSYPCNLNSSFDPLYLSTRTYYLKFYKFDNTFRVYKKNIVRKSFLELNCIIRLILKLKFKSIGYRILAGVYKLFKHKPIWLVLDRINAAGDNGEAFFDYLMKRKEKKYKIRFVISKGSKDYARMQKKYPKNIIAYKSFKHKIYHLCADMIISAHADDYVVNIFGKGKKFLSDFYNFKFVFLQHGITKDDLSPWLNVNSHYIHLFITAAKNEYNSFVSEKYRYNYPSKCFKLTGFARYDKLINSSSNCKTIAILPTWRKYLVSGIDYHSGVRSYDPMFKETDYFKFYNALLNNDKLIALLKEKGYKIRFIPHINMHQQIRDFTANDLVEFVISDVDYASEFKNNKLLITDYSSVFFDFSYLNKPVIYSQFDKEKFFEGQIYDQGYFSYEEHGFGPVCYNLEDTVDEIINIINNGFAVDPKYIKRMKSFYEYNDQNNCNRIFNEVENL